MLAKKKPSGPSAPPAPAPAVIEAQQFPPPPAYVSVVIISPSYHCVFVVTTDTTSWHARK